MVINELNIKDKKDTIILFTIKGDKIVDSFLDSYLKKKDKSKIFIVDINENDASKMETKIKIQNFLKQSSQINISILGHGSVTTLNINNKMIEAPAVVYEISNVNVKTYSPLTLSQMISDYIPSASFEKNKKSSKISIKLLCCNTGVRCVLSKDAKSAVEISDEDYFKNKNYYDDNINFRKPFAESFLEELNQYYSNIENHNPVIIDVKAPIGNLRISQYSDKMRYDIVALSALYDTDCAVKGKPNDEKIAEKYQSKLLNRDSDGQKIISTFNIYS